jgi:hypothetical protein
MKWLLTISMISCLLQYGCAGTRPSDEEHVSQGQKVAISVDAVSIDTTKGPVYLRLTNSDGSLRDQQDMLFVGRALKLDGYERVSSPKKADFDVQVTFERKDPFTVKNVLGKLTPYTHRVLLRAAKNKKTVWEITLTAKSEFENRGNVLPEMLLAGISFYGQHTNGEIQVEVDETDKRIDQIQPRTRP